jgi:hypothetical protein
VVVDGTTLIVYIDASVIMTSVIMIGANPMRVMRVGVVNSAGCSQIGGNVALSLDVVLQICCQQRHDGAQLGNQKEAQEPGRKPAQFA